jgi:hypothetical protein
MKGGASVVWDKKELTKWSSSEIRVIIKLSLLSKDYMNSVF